MSSAREQILDAYQAILARDGERAATMDAIAARAGVSKGGLLYHFGSKELLAEGLCQRLFEQVTVDVQKMRSAPEGAASYYVRTSQYEGSPLDLLIIAVARLNQAGYAKAEEAFERIDSIWFEVLLETIGDAATAYSVKLLGDGLYYRTILGEVGPADSPPRVPMEEILQVVDRLIRTKGES